MEEKMEFSRIFNSIVRSLNQKQKIPAWVITVIVIANFVIISTKISFYLQALILLILLIIVWLVSSWHPTRKGFTGLSGHQFTISDYPKDITPVLLDISSDEKDELEKLPTDGIGMITSIVGNLVFYDKDEKPVFSFSSPVKLTYNYTDADEQGVKDRQTFLMAQQKEQGIKEPKEINVDFIPIYLYTLEEEGKPVIKIWKPFQNFTLNEVNHTVTIEFLFWGDQQFGGGTKP
jgi:hypothetical protein